jgi:hypothetical protein
VAELGHGRFQYWLTAGSKPQYRSIRIDRLFRYYTLRLWQHGWRLESHAHRI